MEGGDGSPLLRGKHLNAGALKKGAALSAAWFRVLSAP